MAPSAPSPVGAAAAPGHATLRRYQRAWLRGDLAAGLTIGALLITQCMAYAPLAGLPPEAAFRAVVVALPIYAVLGTSRHLVVGPDPGTAAIAGAGLASVAALGSTEYVAAAAALALLVGALLVVAQLLRFGFVADLLSRPALVGYLAGLGATLLVSQVSKLTGIPVESEDFFPRIGDIVTGLGEVDPATAATGLGTLGLVLLVRWKGRGLPGAVVGVVVATLVSVLFSLDEHGVAVVGELDATLAAPSLPGLPLDDWVALVPTAIAVAVLGYADSFLTAKGVAGQRKYDLDANRELGALGGGNLVAGAFGGMPVSSTGSGTAAASSAGGVTQVTFLVASAFVVVGLLAVPGAIEAIPIPALAAVVASAAIGLIDVPAFRSLWQVSRIELLLAVATFLAVGVFDVLVGILLSIGLGVVIALYRMARPHDAVLGDAAHLDGWVEVGAGEVARTEPGLLVYRFDAPLLFVNAGWFAERVKAVLEENPGEERWVVLDFEGVGSLDTTAAEVLQDLVDGLLGSGVEVVAVARANTDVLDRLGRANLLAPAGPLRPYPTINGAVRAFRETR